MPPVIAASLIGGVFGLGSTILSGRNANRQQQRTANDPLALAQQGLIEQQTRVGKWGFENAQRVLPQAEEAIGIPYQQYKNILGGGDAARRAVGGPLNAISDQFASQRQNLARSGQRGNVASLLGRSGTEEAKAKGGVMFDAYSGALGGIQNSAQQYGNLFGTLLSGGTQATQGALGAVTAQRSSDSALLLQQARDRNQTLNQLGGGAGLLLSLLLNRSQNGTSSRSSSASSTGGGSYADAGYPDWSNG